MLDVIMTLLSIYGLTYLVKESDVLSAPRNFVMMHSVFLAKMLHCWFCTGFWCSLAVYYARQTSWGSVVLWCLAGAAISSFLNVIYSRISWVKVD